MFTRLGRGNDDPVAWRVLTTDADRHHWDARTQSQVRNSVLELLYFRSRSPRALWEHDERLTTGEDRLASLQRLAVGPGPVHREGTAGEEEPADQLGLPDLLLHDVAQSLAPGDPGDDQPVDIGAVHRRHDEGAAGR